MRARRGLTHARDGVSDTRLCPRSSGGQCIAEGGHDRARWRKGAELSGGTCGVQGFGALLGAVVTASEAAGAEDNQGGKSDETGGHDHQGAGEEEAIDDSQRSPVGTRRTAVAAGSSPGVGGPRWRCSGVDRWWLHRPCPPRTPAPPRPPIVAHARGQSRSGRARSATCRSRDRHHHSIGGQETPPTTAQGHARRERTGGPGHRLPRRLGESRPGRKRSRGVRHRGVTARGGPPSSHHPPVRRARLKPRVRGPLSGDRRGGLGGHQTPSRAG